MKGPAICMAMVSLAGIAQAQTSSEAAVATTPTAAPSALIRAGDTAAGGWIVSETRSPVDYSPVAVAIATSNGLQLAIHCRGGRSEMVLSSLSLTLRPQDHLVFYAIDGAPSVAIATAEPQAGAGLFLRIDVPRFLMALPGQGDIVLRITDRTADVATGRYGLAELKKLVARLAGPCAWPAAAGR